MYGTLARYRPRPDQDRAVAEFGRRWLRERAPEAPGFVAEYILTPEGRPGERFALAIFESRASYRQNAGDPEHARWHHQLRELLAEDPEVTAGDILALEPATVPL